jgi:NADH:ubiquinone oxidoreductase subunit 4 (subunit M)
MILTFIFQILLISLFALFLLPSTYSRLIETIALGASASVFFLSCLFLIEFDDSTYFFFNVVTYAIDSSLMNFSFSCGLDGISLFFLF